MTRVAIDTILRNGVIESAFANNRCISPQRSKTTSIPCHRDGYETSSRMRQLLNGGKFLGRREMGLLIDYGDPYRRQSRKIRTLATIGICRQACVRLGNVLRDWLSSRSQTGCQR